MEEGEKHTVVFRTLLSRDTTLEDLSSLLSNFITDEERELLKDNPSKKVITSLLSLGAFAPEPETFDKETFSTVAAVNDDGVALPYDEVVVLLSIVKRVGVVKEVDENLIVDQDIHVMLERLLDESERN